MHWLPPADGDPWLRCELTSRGDRIQARLQLPAGAPGDAGRWPLALIAGPDARSLPRAEAMALAWLDLPLRGERASPKWSERLEACLARGPTGASDQTLLDGFLAQARSDVARVLDACAARDGLDAGRMAFAGLGAGALVGATLRGVEPRLRAFLLAPGALAPPLDPICALAAPAPGTLALLASDDAGDRAAAWARAAGTSSERGTSDPLARALALAAHALAATPVRRP